MKKIKKAILYTYRILLFFSIIGVITGLFTQALLRCCKWFIYFYPPYTAWIAIFVVSILSIYLIAADFYRFKKREKEQVPHKETDSPDLWQETKELVERCLSQYPYAIEKSDSCYIIRLNDGDYGIYITPGNMDIEVHVSLCGWTEHFYYADSLEKLEEEFSSNLHDWLNDRTVQVCFITGGEKFPYSFVCTVADMDETIPRSLECFSDDPLWFQILRTIFLFPPAKPVKEIHVASANGIQDRVIPVINPHTFKTSG